MRFTNAPRAELLRRGSLPSVKAACTQSSGGFTRSFVVVAAAVRLLFRFCFDLEKFRLEALSAVGESQHKLVSDGFPAYGLLQIPPGKLRELTCRDRARKQQTIQFTPRRRKEGTEASTSHFFQLQICTLVAHSLKGASRASGGLFGVGVERWQKPWPTLARTQRHTVRNVCGDSSRKQETGRRGGVAAATLAAVSLSEQDEPAIVCDHCAKCRAPLQNSTTRLFRLASVANARNTPPKNNCRQSFGGVGYRTAVTETEAATTITATRASLLRT